MAQEHSPEPTPSPLGPAKRKFKPLGWSSSGAVNSSASSDPPAISNPTKKRLRGRAALTKTKKSKRGSPSVRFGHVAIREHGRELGGSCGVPYTGLIALGLSNEYRDHKAINIDLYEQIRAKERGGLQETPEKVRRMLLKSAMGSETFEKSLKREQSAVQWIKECREDSVANDSRYLETFDDVDGNEIRIGLDPSTADRHNAIDWLCHYGLDQPDFGVASPPPPKCSLESVGSATCSLTSDDGPTCALQTIGSATCALQTIGNATAAGAPDGGVF